MQPNAETVTRLINAASAGDGGAANELLPLIYEELRGLARASMRGGNPGRMLQPTALVHEAYLRLFGKSDVDWNSRGHFFSAAARVMRNILVDQARRSGAQKRGGKRARVDLDAGAAAVNGPTVDVLALDECLSQLAESDPRKAQIATLHCFCGLTLEEVAAALEVSLSTVEREWRFTRALLHEQLAD